MVSISPSPVTAIFTTARGRRWDRWILRVHTGRLDRPGLGALGLSDRSVRSRLEPHWQRLRSRHRSTRPRWCRSGWRRNLGQRRWDERERFRDHVSKAHQVKHKGSRVDVYIARLVPPWFDLAIPIRGNGGTLVATVWLLSRRKVRRALREAGFDVVEHVTWIDRGFSWAEMKSGSSPNPPNTVT